MTDRELECAVTEIREHMDAIHESKDRLFQHLTYEKIAALRREVATEYGRRRGWKYVNRQGWAFNIDALAECKIWAGTRYGSNGLDTRYMDHPYFYRYPDKRAAAIVAHPYGIPADVARWAKSWNLSFKVSGVPSWWNPGGTNTIEYTATPETLARVRRERDQADDQAIERRALLEQYPPVFAVYDSIGKCDNQINRWSRECDAKGEPCVYARRLSRFWMVQWFGDYRPHVDALTAIAARYWKRRRAMRPYEISKGYIDGLTYPEALEAAFAVYTIFKGGTHVY